MCCSYIQLKLKHFCLRSFVQPLVTMDSKAETTVEPGRSARIRARMEASIKLRAELMEPIMARAEVRGIEYRKQRQKLREQRIEDRKQRQLVNAINSQLQANAGNTPERELLLWWRFLFVFWAQQISLQALMAVFVCVALQVFMLQMHLFVWCC